MDITKHNVKWIGSQTTQLKGDSTKMVRTFIIISDDGTENTFTMFADSKKDLSITEFEDRREFHNKAFEIVRGYRK